MEKVPIGDTKEYRTVLTHLANFMDLTVTDPNFDVHLVQLGQSCNELLAVVNNQIKDNCNQIPKAFGQIAPLNTKNSWFFKLGENYDHVEGYYDVADGVYVNMNTANLIVDHSTQAYVNNLIIQGCGDCSYYLRTTVLETIELLLSMSLGGRLRKNMVQLDGFVAAATRVKVAYLRLHGYRVTVASLHREMENLAETFSGTEKEFVQCLEGISH